MKERRSSFISQIPSGHILFLLCLHWCAQSVYGTGCQIKRQIRPGDTVNSLGEQFSHRGMKRLYRIHIPKKYNPLADPPSPLVLFLHGNAGSARKAARNSGFLDKSEAEGFMLVFPEGIHNYEIAYSPGASRICSWNAGTCCSTAHKEQVNDVAYIEEVISDVQRRYCVSQDNVFIAGFANGGMMAYRLACEIGHRIKAISVYAGALLFRDTRECTVECMGYPTTQNKCFNTLKCTRENIENLPPIFECHNDQHPVSVLHMHGLKDPRTPFKGGIGKKNIEEVNYLPVELTLDYLASKSGCSVSKKDIFRNRTKNREQAVCIEYLGCPHKSYRFVLCKLTNGGHYLPGISSPFCNPRDSRRNVDRCRVAEQEMGPTSDSLDFTQMSWDFFRRAMENSRTPQWAARNNHASAVNLITTWHLCLAIIWTVVKLSL